MAVEYRADKQPASVQNRTPDVSCHDPMRPNFATANGEAGLRLVRLLPCVGGRTSQASDDVTRHNQLHPAILLAAGCRVVRRDRLTFSKSMRADGGGSNALADQKIAYRIRAVF